MAVAPGMDFSQAFREQISAQDRGFLYGDGVFETFRCRFGKLLLRDLHQRRLLLSCERLGMTLDPAALNNWLDNLAEAAPSNDIVLKVIISRGQGGRGYAPPTPTNYTLLAQWHSLPDGLASAWHDGIDCVICHHPLSENVATAGIKHLNRLDQVMASRELAAAMAVHPSAREGLMLDQHARLVEGTRSNFFIVIDGKVHTPDLSRSGVAGVMRQWILEVLAELNTPAQVTDLEPGALQLASEMFICNSVFGIWPVANIGRLDQNLWQPQARFDDRRVCRALQARAQDLFIS